MVFPRKGLLNLGESNSKYSRSPTTPLQIINSKKRCSVGYAIVRDGRNLVSCYRGNGVNERMVDAEWIVGMYPWAELS